MPFSRDSGRVRTSARSRQRPSPEDTRRDLLDAGLRLLAEDPAANAFGHLKAGRVAAEAGRTSGAFFHHWASQDDYVLDLIDYAFQPEQSATLTVVDQALERSFSTEESAGATLLSVCRAALRSLPSEPQTAIEFLMWKRASSDPQFGEWVRGRYRELDAVGSPLFARLVELTGRRVRPPFTVESAAALVTAVAHGLLLRHLVEDETYPPDILGWVVVALLPLLTAAHDDDLGAARIVDQIAIETLGAPIGTERSAKAARQT
jgi:AcrR family transcriptional regulator